MLLISNRLIMSKNHIKFKIYKNKPYNKDNFYINQIYDNIYSINNNKITSSYIYNNDDFFKKTINKTSHKISEMYQDKYKTMKNFRDETIFNLDKLYLPLIFNSIQKASLNGLSSSYVTINISDCLVPQELKLNFTEPQIIQYWLGKHMWVNRLGKNLNCFFFQVMEDDDNTNVLIKFSWGF